MKDLLLDKISLEGIEMSHPTNAIVKAKCLEQPVSSTFKLINNSWVETRSKVCKVLLGIIAPGILPHSAERKPTGNSSGKFHFSESRRVRSKETNQKCGNTWGKNIPTPPEMLPMRYTLEMFSMSVKKKSASLRSDTIHRCSQFFDRQVALAAGSSQSKPSNHEPNDE